LFERYRSAAAGTAMAMQSSMFPVTLTLSTPDAILLELLIDDLKLLGYLIEPFGKDSFVIQGTPADIREGNEKNTIENLLEQYKHFSASLQFSNREKVIRSLAQQHAIKAGVKLELSEMQMIVQSLFECSQPNATAGGYPTYVEFKKDYIERLFTK
jgi:DNA mismatch repair protein MutL